HPPRPAMESVALDGHPVRREVLPHLILVERAQRYTDVVDVPPAVHRRHRRGRTGVSDVPQHDQRRAAPHLFHPERWIRVAGWQPSTSPYHFTALSRSSTRKTTWSMPTSEKGGVVILVRAQELP